jgi:thioredoxin-like negative regulator of GroEL
MRIPTVTDEIAEKVIGCAVSPVALLVMGLSEESVWTKECLEIVADDYDDKIIFLRLLDEENPNFSDRLLVRVCPTLIIFKGATATDRIADPKKAAEIREVLERTLDKGRA